MKPLKNRVSLTLDEDIIEKINNLQRMMIGHSANM